MSFLLEKDALNGKQGKAFITKDGKNIELFSVKKAQADAEFSEDDLKVVGTSIVQKKTTGVSYTGSMTIYYGTPHFVRMLEEYQKTGKMPYFTLQLTNDDPGTSVGRQTVALYNVKLQKVPIAMLDADANWLEMEVSFSFTNFEILEYFKDAPDQLGQ